MIIINNYQKPRFFLKRERIIKRQPEKEISYLNYIEKDKMLVFSEKALKRITCFETEREASEFFGKYCIGILAKSHHPKSKVSLYFKKDIIDKIIFDTPEVELKYFGFQKHTTDSQYESDFGQIKETNTYTIESIII